MAPYLKRPTLHVPGMDNMDTMPTDFHTVVEPDPCVVGNSGLNTAAVEVEIFQGEVTFLPGETKAPPPPSPVPKEVEVETNEEDKQDQQEQPEKNLGHTTSTGIQVVAEDVTKKEVLQVQVVETAPKNDNVQDEKVEVEVAQTEVKKDKETKDVKDNGKEDVEPVPPGWGNAKYISPADQQAVAKAKAKGKAKAKATPPKQQQVQEVKKSRVRARSASAVPAVVEPPPKKGKRAKDAKTTPKAKPKAAPQPLSEGKKRKGSTQKAAVTAKVRKVDASEKEALRSKKCCAYQKVLRSLLREGIPQEEAREKAKEVARMHILQKAFVCESLYYIIFIYIVIRAIMLSPGIPCSHRVSCIFLMAMLCQVFLNDASTASSFWG